MDPCARPSPSPRGPPPWAARARPAGPSKAAARKIIDRRSFLRSAFGGSVGLAASFAWPLSLAALAAAPAEPASGGAGGAGAAAGGPRKPQPESNRKMAELLAKITREADPMRNPFRNREQAAILNTMKAQATDPQRLFQLRIKLAWQYLDSGDADAALKEYDAIMQYMEDNKVPAEERREIEWLTFKAVCYLRMGENENCLENHNGDSCIFPISQKRCTGWSAARAGRSRC